MFVGPYIIAQFTPKNKKIKKSNKMQQCINILLFHIYMKLNNVHQLHVQQASTYEKPEAASAVLGS